MYDEIIITGLFRLHNNIYTNNDGVFLTKIFKKNLFLLYREGEIKIYGLGFENKQLFDKFLCQFIHNNDDDDIVDDNDDDDNDDNNDLSYSFNTKIKIDVTQLGGVYTVSLHTMLYNQIGIILADDSLVSGFINKLHQKKPSYLFLELIKQNQTFINIFLYMNDDTFIITEYTLILNINSLSTPLFKKLLALQNTRFFYDIKNSQELDYYLLQIPDFRRCPLQQENDQH